MRLGTGLAARVITATAIMAGLAGAAHAEQAYIRVEAKRGAAAAEAAAQWQARFPDVVTYPLTNGMTAVALGPTDADEAAVRLKELKAEGAIPSDSFVTAPARGAVVTPVAGNGAATPDTEAGEAAQAGTAQESDEATSGTRSNPAAAASTASLLDPAPALPGSDAGLSEEDREAAADATDDITDDTSGTADAVSADDTAADASLAGFHVQLQATSDENLARRLLTQWRADFPAAGLWRLPSGWFAIALPAEPEAQAETRRTALIREGRIPSDAFIAKADRMGTEIEAPGVATDAPAATESRPDDAATDADAMSEGDSETGDDESAADRLTPDSADPVTNDATSEADEAETDATDLAQQSSDPLEVTESDTPEADGTGEPDQTSAKDETEDAASDQTMPAEEETEAPATPSEPATPAVMPPITEVQEALRWAGYYEGEIDGLSGPGTRAAIDEEIAAVSPGAEPAEAMVALLARREDWRKEMGLWAMRDRATGITLAAPTARLAFDRVERGMSIYGPKDGSGAALILVSRAGDATALSEFAGFVTALGWVPDPKRVEERSHISLEGQDDDHHGHAELWLKDGVIEGFIQIWPADDADNARRLALEALESFERDSTVPPLIGPGDAEDTAEATPDAMPDTTPADSRR